MVVVVSLNQFFEALNHIRERCPEGGAMTLPRLVDELENLRDGYGDARRTEIVADLGDLTIEDLIAEEEMVITVSKSRYFAPSDHPASGLSTRRERTVGIRRSLVASRDSLGPAR